MPVQDFDASAEVLILIFVRGNDTSSRDFMRKTVGMLNQHASNYRFQSVFIFGKHYGCTEQDEARWKLENDLHQDLIITSN